MSEPFARRDLPRALALVAIVLLIVIFGTMLMSRPAGESLGSPSPATSASASASPSVTVQATTTTSAAATAAGIRPDDAHGFLTFDPNGIRTEARSDPLTTFTQQYTAAVSPDGRRVAAIITAQTGQQLITFDTARPNQRTTVLDLAGSGEFAVAAPAWAGDGSDSVLIGVSKPGAPTGVEAPPAYSTLRAVELRTRVVREIARTTNSFVLVPIAWLPQSATGAAIESGPGGFAFSYVLVQGDKVTRTSFEPSPPQGNVLASSVVASVDGRRVLALYGRDAPVSVRWWPVDRFDGQRELKPTSGETVRRAIWRPGADEIVVSSTLPGVAAAAGGIDVWSLGGAKRGVSKDGGLALVRVDGTAALTVDYRLIDLTTGASTQVAHGVAERPYLALRF